MARTCRTLLLASFAALAPSLASAGPPLLCFPMSVHGPSLPWGDGPGWKTPKAGYDLSRLTDDTVALLASNTPVLARMETLRRAVIYAAPDPATVNRMLDALRARAGRPGDANADPLAQFDLGYFVEAVRQARHGLARLSAGPSEDGYALVRAALARRPGDPAMEYAAALIALAPTTRAATDRHLRAALEAAATGSDLAKTIEAHRPLWGDQLDAIRRTASR